MVPVVEHDMPSNPLHLCYPSSVTNNSSLMHIRMHMCDFQSCLPGFIQLGMIITLVCQNNDAFHLNKSKVLFAQLKNIHG